MSLFATVWMNDIIASLPTEQGLILLGGFASLVGTAPIVELNVSDNAIGQRTGATSLSEPAAVSHIGTTDDGKRWVGQILHGAVEGYHYSRRRQWTLRLQSIDLAAFVQQHEWHSRSQVCRRNYGALSQTRILLLQRLPTSARGMPIHCQRIAGI
jgi:hypothetical protein